MAKRSPPYGVIYALRPPPGDGDGGRQSANVVPPAWWDVEGLAGPQHRLDEGHPRQEILGLWRVEVDAAEGGERGRAASFSSLVKTW